MIVKRHPRRQPPDLVVRTLSQAARQGVLQVGGRVVRCAVGRRGLAAIKREGDGKTPMGRWSIDGVLYRGDRALPPATRLPVRRIGPNDGWCDAVEDRNYNRPVTHPYPLSAEHLWRADALYDIVVVLGYNIRPRVKCRGSAIFMHLARPDWTPTAGCIALRRRDLVDILQRVGRGSRIIVAR